MTIHFGAVSLASNVGATTQDFTSTALGGATGDAAIFLTGMWRGDNAVQGGAQSSIGFCANDGTSTGQWVSSITLNNNVTTSDTKHRYATDQVCMRNATSGSIRSEAAWDSWITNGVRIDWNDAEAQNRQAAAILIADTSGAADFYVDSFEITAPDQDVGDSTTISDPGFGADLVFLTGNYASTDDTTGDDAQIFFGVWVKDKNQGCVAWFSEDNVGTTNVREYLSTEYAGFELGSTGTRAGLELGADNNGFTVTVREASAATFGKVGYLAIKFGTRSEKELVVHDVPDTTAGTGTDATTGVGFQPDWLVGIQSGVPTVDTEETGGQSAAFGVGFSDGTTEESVAWKDDDNVGTTNADSIRNSKFATMVRGGTTGKSIGAVDSLDPGGFTIDWTAVSLPATGKSLALCITEDVIIRATTATAAATAGTAVLVPSVTITATEATASATANAPTLVTGKILAPDAAEAAATANAPTLGLAAALRPPSANVAATAQTATLGLAKVLGPDAAEAAATANAPTLGLVKVLRPATASVAATANAPTLDLSAVFTPDAAEAVATAPAATLSIGGTLLSPPAAIVKAWAEEALLLTEHTLVATEAVVASSAQTATLSTGKVLRPPTASVAATAQAATLVENTAVLLADVAVVQAVAEEALFYAQKALIATEATAAATAPTATLGGPLLASVASVQAIAQAAALVTVGPKYLQPEVAFVIASVPSGFKLIRLGEYATGRAQTSAPGWERGQITAPGFGRLELAAPYWGKGQNHGR